MNLNRELIKEIDSYVENSIKKRLWDKSGGVNTDYENFCNEDDMVWIKEEVDNDFDYVAESINRPNSLSKKEFEEEKESRDFERYIERKKEEVLEEIDSIERNLGLHKIYDHIVNEVENRYKYKTPKEALEGLEKVLLEKEVVSDLEELEEIESYQKAKAYAESYDPNSSKKEECSSVEKEEDTFEVSDSILDFIDKGFEDLEKEQNSVDQIEFAKAAIERDREKLEEIKNAESIEFSFLDLGLPIENFVESLIRKGGSKEEIKKLEKQGFITAKQKKEFIKQAKEYLKPKEYSYNFVENEELEEKLGEIKAEYKENTAVSELDLKIELIEAGSNIHKKFIKKAKYQIKELVFAQNEILKQGSFDNPLILKYYENIHIMHEQAFIFIEYIYKKILKAASAGKLEDLYDIREKEIENEFNELTDDLKQSLSRFVYYAPTSLFNFHYRYNSRDIMFLFLLNIIEQHREAAFEQLKTMTSDKLLNEKFIKTILNILESLFNQARHELNCLSDKEIKRRFEEWNWSSEEGKYAFLSLYKELKEGGDYTKENLLEISGITDMKELDKLLEEFKAEISLIDIRI